MATAAPVFSVNTDVTCTIRSIPQRLAGRKTIQRLIQMDPAVAKVLRNLQGRRRRVDNKTYIRAGVAWTDRAKAARPARVELGHSFTIRVTPQIVADLNSVAAHLDVG
jgi:hypothetical protein